LLAARASDTTNVKHRLRSIALLVCLGLAAPSAVSSTCVTDGLSAIARDKSRVDEPFKVLDPKRLASVVKVYEPGSPGYATALSKLHSEDGVYAYVMDSRGRVAIVNKTIPLPAGEALTERSAYVGSHSGLVAYLNSLGGDLFEIVAAGELRTIDGTVNRVSNASGTYSGGAEHLKYAQGRFAEMGLAVDGDTQIVDYAKSYDKRKGLKDKHISDAAQAKAELKFRADPELMRLHEETRATMAIFRNRARALEEKMMDGVVRSKDRALRFRLQEALSFRSRWIRWPESGFAVLDHAVDSYGIDELRKVLALIREQAGAP
jgi:hypothetical protein